MDKYVEEQEKPCQACIWFDRYEVKEILGAGGAGKVYLAKDIRLGRPVAVKILEKVTEQFQEEVAVLRQQSFRMLPTIYDAWKEDNRTGVIVMEYVEGQNLKEYLALHGQIPEKQIYEWGLQLGGFLRELHSRHPKVLYRDLKPENIMVQPNKMLRLVDVGAAVRGEPEEMCRYKRVGTYGYAAPEQWEGKEVDERTDIYGLGAVLYEVIVGAGRVKQDEISGTGRVEQGVISGAGRVKQGAMSGVESVKQNVISEYIAERGKAPAGMMRAVRRCLYTERCRRYATAEAFLTDWKQYKNVGRAGNFFRRAQVMMCYIFLYAAVYIIWYKSELITLAWRFLAGYLLLKTAAYIGQKHCEKWEQKKSVWCRGFS